MSATTKTASKKPRRDLRVALNPKERFLLIVYRSLTFDQQLAIDEAVSVEWTRPKRDSQTLKESNDRFGAAIQRFKAEHMSSKFLSYYANVGRRAEVQ